MATFEVQGPDGSLYDIDAPTIEEAGAFADQYFQVGGHPENFQQAFDPSQDSPETAEGLDERVYGEADDRGRWATAGNALTMGFGDEVLGTLMGGLTYAQGEGFEKGYDAITQGVRGDIDQYAERRPWEHAAISIGAGAVPIVAGGLGAKVISNAIPAVARVAGSAGRVATSGAGGAVAGGVAGFGEGEGGIQNRLESGAVGAGIGAVTGAGAGWLGTKIGNAAGSRAGKKAVPTSNQWEQKASALYQEADNLGVAVGSRALGRISQTRQDIGNMIADPNIAPEAFKELYPKTLASLQVLDGIARNPTMTLRNIETYRGMLLDAVMDAQTPKDGRFAGIILRKFDDWVDHIHPTEYVGANAAGPRAQQLYKEARRLWRIKSKAQTIEAVVKRAEDNTVDAPGRAAFAQALVTGFKQLRRNDALMAGFSDTEKKFIRDAAGGRWDQKTLKAIEMMMPGFSLTRAGQAAGWGTASALSGSPVPLLAAGAAGTGARVVRNRSIIKSADRASQVMRNDGAVPFDPVAAKAAGDYSQRLLQAAGQPTAGEMAPGRIDVMFPNDSPFYR